MQSPGDLDAGWIYTGGDERYGLCTALFALHQLPAPAAAASVTSTLALLAMLARSHRLAAGVNYWRAPAGCAVCRCYHCRKGLPLQIGAGLPVTNRIALPSVRHFMAHLHQTAYHEAEPNRDHHCLRRLSRNRFSRMQLASCCVHWCWHVANWSPAEGEPPAAGG